MDYSIVTGSELNRYVREIVIPDLEKMAELKTNPATPSSLSEAYTCCLMGWGWVKGNKPHDAVDGSVRIQIKYAQKGFVGCKPNAWRKWDLLCWVHAPNRLPKLVILVQSASLSNDLLRGNTLRVEELESVASRFVKVYQFGIRKPAEIWIARSRRLEVDIRSAFAAISSDISPRCRSVDYEKHERITRNSVETEDPFGDDEDETMIVMNGRGYSARGYSNDVDSVTVSAGSIFRAYEAPALEASARRRRAEMLRKGQLVKRDGGLVLVSDTDLESHSLAAQVVSGTQVNGWRTWKYADGRPLCEE